MRNKILILIPIMLLVLVLVGCIPGITPTPEPEEPEQVMEANVTAELVEAQSWAIEWTIVNTGDVNIFKYIITFRVYYPMKDYVEVEVTDTALAVGTHHEGVLPLADYGEGEDPWSVSATWELSE